MASLLLERLLDGGVEGVEGGLRRGHVERAGVGVLRECCDEAGGAPVQAYEGRNLSTFLRTLL